MDIEIIEAGGVAGVALGAAVGVVFLCYGASQFLSNSKMQLNVNANVNANANVDANVSDLMKDYLKSQQILKDYS
jgi:hypothetical protein